jgi:ribonuclease D
MPEVVEQIVSTPEELADCCAFLAGCNRIGFDTEFVGEETYHPRLCLVQVAAPERLFLIDPLSVGPLETFWQLLLDPGRLVVVHAGREEVRLCRLWTGQVPANLFDLQLAAGLVGLPWPLGHGALVGRLLGVHLSKIETLTEWRHRPLTASQIRYAFDDVRYLLRAQENLSARLERLGRTAWAREEFTRLTSIWSPATPANEERWRKLRGLGSLDRRKLAVVRALFNWREEEAARTNRPTRSIARDDLLIEISRRNPTKARDLQVIRGLPKRDLETIVQVVQEAQALPLDQCPHTLGREQDAPQVGLVSSVLLAVLADLCTRRHLTPTLVATTSDIKDLVRSRLSGEPPEEAPLHQGWRAEHILPDLVAFLEGRRALRVADLRQEAPFEYADVEDAAE